MADNISKTKQVAISGLVVLVFIAYSVNQRGEKPDHPVVAPAAKPQTSQGAAPGTAQSASSTTSIPAPAAYKDGAYTGSVADAYYGNIQVRAIVSGGKLSDVKFLQYPRDNQNSISINQQAMPFLKQEAIAAQKAHVDVVSGATDTSYAFVQSLAAALAKAH